MKSVNEGREIYSHRFKNKCIVIPDGPGADPWADPSKQQAQ